MLRVDRVDGEALPSGLHLLLFSYLLTPARNMPALVASRKASSLEIVMTPCLMKRVILPIGW